jgi:hypothetical protein
LNTNSILRIIFSFSLSIEEKSSLEQKAPHSLLSRDLKKIGAAPLSFEKDLSLLSNPAARRTV